MITKHRTFLMAFLITLLHTFALTAQENWKVIDGDTIRQGEKVIRFWGIDSPEINQRCLKKDGTEYKCGEDAKTALEVLIQNKPLICEYLNKDRYKRDVARCNVDGIDVGGLMISLGWAVDYARYSKGYYALEQQQAQEAERGIWNGEFVMPNEWRRNKR